MKALILLSVLFLSTSTLISAQFRAILPEIRQISLFESNRDDVRRTLLRASHDASQRNEKNEVFKLADGTLHVEYSSGGCQEGEANNVEQDKVVGVYFTPSNEVALSDVVSILSYLGLTLKDFKKEQLYLNVPDKFVYHNQKSGIAFVIGNEKLLSFAFGPPKRLYSVMCDQQFARHMLRKNTLFGQPLKRRLLDVEAKNYVPDVESLILSFDKIVPDCAPRSSDPDIGYGVNAVTAFATGLDPEGDVLTFAFEVSGGKINKTRDLIDLTRPNHLIYGGDAVWDLSGVGPGTYTITAIADDGCGFCGKSITKSVVVKPCGE